MLDQCRVVLKHVKLCRSVPFADEGKSLGVEIHEIMAYVIQTVKVML